MAPRHQDDEEKVEFPPTAPTDARFPNANATKFCFTMFVDYHRCTRLFSKGHAPCDHFKQSYTSICPKEWIEKWEQQINEGIFPVTLPKEKK